MGKFVFGYKPEPKKVQKPQNMMQTIKEVGLMRLRMMKFDFKIFGGWAIAGILILALFLTIWIFKHQTDETLAKSARLVEYNNEMGEFFITWQNKLASQNKNETIKTLYIAYASDIIIKHYQNNQTTRYRQMSKSEIYDFLSLIYDYANSGAFETADEFLPLAYAVVETDFYFNPIGLDGERTVFQFMEQTAQYVYRQHGRPYFQGWYNSINETVWLWFHFHRELSLNFLNVDKEREIRWTALAYNAGLYRNRLIPYYKADSTIERYLYDYPLNKGISTYNRQIYEKYMEYRSGFKAIYNED